MSNTNQPIEKQNIASGIFTLDSVLSESECQSYIDYAENIGFEAATVALPGGSKLMKSVRNNQRVTVDSTEIADLVWSRIQHLIPSVDELTPTRLNERIRFYKYEKGERFNKHRDGRFSTDDEESRLTILIYLNSGFEGGETEFENNTITATTGTGLCFVHEIKHKGCSIDQGIKYVLRTDIMFKKE